MRRAAPLLLAALLSGCRASDAVNKNYDLGRIRSVGVLTFEYGRHPPFGAEDMFAKRLLERGYQVIERARLEAVLREQKLGASGALRPQTAKRLGKLLGIDALILGQVTTYEPERKLLVTVDSRSTREEPVFETRTEKGPDGEPREVKRQIGKKVTEEVQKLPVMLPVDAEVGFAVKLVDVETGELAWVGSDTSQGVNAPLAAEAVAAYLVKRLSKKWKPQPPEEPARLSQRPPR
ncbi:MAG: hypothetical protein HY554_15590 [Elusimicrobia bacterium]|nr:hypothetical protein [Elusimicrobiota bacterium]